MSVQTSAELQSSRCRPCEGGVNACSTDEAKAQLDEFDDWRLSDDGKHIYKNWTSRDFMSGISFLNEVAQIAEEQGHHPDVSLKNYKEVTIALTTHAIGGLSENDFILAAKIDGLLPPGS